MVYLQKMKGSDKMITLLKFRNMDNIHCNSCNIQNIIMYKLRIKNEFSNSSITNYLCKYCVEDLTNININERNKEK